MLLFDGYLLFTFRKVEEDPEKEAHRFGEKKPVAGRSDSRYSSLRTLLAIPARELHRKWEKEKSSEKTT